MVIAVDKVEKSFCRSKIERRISFHKSVYKSKENW